MCPRRQTGTGGWASGRAGNLKTHGPHLLLRLAAAGPHYHTLAFQFLRPRPSTPTGGDRQFVSLCPWPFPVTAFPAYLTALAALTRLSPTCCWLVSQWADSHIAFPRLPQAVWMGMTTLDFIQPFPFPVTPPQDSDSDRHPQLIYPSSVSDLPHYSCDDDRHVPPNVVFGHLGGGDRRQTKQGH